MTAPGSLCTLPTMERALLQKILEKTPGLQKAEKGFVCEDEHRATLYLDIRGGTNTLSELVGITLFDDYLQAETKNRTVHNVLYEPIVGVSMHRPPKESGRTGF